LRAHAKPLDGGKLQLFVSVSDSGIGIDEAKQGALFHAFAQADSSIARKFGGTGLGLALCKALVEGMGGKIGLSSEAGKGSAFFFDVLLEPCPEEDSALLLHPPAAGVQLQCGLASLAGKRVLSVDDNRINLRVLRGFLKPFSPQGVVDCLSGEEALEAVDAGRFDLIFMDHMMPGMDGIEAVRRLRAKGGWLASVPIVALTANVMEGMSGVFLANGFSACLAKPLERGALAQVLWRFFGEGARQGGQALPPKA
jgi:CheY-like chemotaxis protein